MSQMQMPMLLFYAALKRKQSKGSANSKFKIQVQATKEDIS
jgi:hypothetical protein